MEARRFVVYRLQLLRGTCIIAVIATHVTEGYREIAMGWLATGLIYANSLARFAVPVFVLLSGFYLSLNSRNQQALVFYRRTLRFLVGPYVLYSFLYTLVFEMPSLPLAALPRTIARTLAFGNAAYHLWFMLLVLELYAVHPFLARWYRARDHRGAVVLLAFGVQIIWPSVLQLDLLPHGRLSTLAFKGLAFLSYLGYFLAGYHLHDYADVVVGMLRQTRSIIIGAIVWLLTGAGVGLHWAAPLAGDTPFEDAAGQDLVLWLLLPMLSIAALPVILKCAETAGAAQNLAGRALSSFGLFSYGVYYLHPLVLVLLSSLLWRYAHLDYDDGLYYAAVFPSVCILSLGAVRILSKTPFGRYLT